MRDDMDFVNCQFHEVLLMLQNCDFFIAVEACRDNPSSEVFLERDPFRLYTPWLHAAYTPRTRQNNAGRAEMIVKSRSELAQHVQHSQHVRWTCVKSTLGLR